MNFSYFLKDERVLTIDVVWVGALPFLQFVHKIIMIDSSISFESIQSINAN